MFGKEGLFVKLNYFWVFGEGKYDGLCIIEIEAWN